MIARPLPRCMAYSRTPSASYQNSCIMASLPTCAWAKSAGKEKTPRQKTRGFPGFEVSVLEIKSLRAFVPRREVVFLLWGEFVDQHVHRIKLEFGDMLVQMIGDGIHLRLEILGVLDHIFGGERLVRKAHVHHGSWVPFGRCEINQPAFPKQIDPAAVLHQKLLDERPSLFPTAGKFFQGRDVDF